MGGIRLGLLKLLPDTRPAEVRTEVQHRQDRLNSLTAEYAFEMCIRDSHTIQKIRIETSLPYSIASAKQGIT